MPIYTESRCVPYHVEQMFNLVADIEKYPEFLPWCMKAQISHRNGPVTVAHLEVGYQMIRETFCSWVKMTPPSRIEVAYTEGPFKYLKTDWIFDPIAEGCRIDFQVNFAFKSWLFQKLTQLLFNEIIGYMVRAFEMRAKHLYGDRTIKNTPLTLPVKINHQTKT